MLHRVRVTLSTVTRSLDFLSRISSFETVNTPCCFMKICLFILHWMFANYFYVSQLNFHTYLFIFFKDFSLFCHHYHQLQIRDFHFIEKNKWISQIKNNNRPKFFLSPLTRYIYGSYCVCRKSS